MRTLQIIPINFMITLLLLSCGGDDSQKARDMITTRTMGLAYLEENNLPEAETAFKQLVSIAPKEALGYANLGLVYIRMGNYTEAEIQLKEALIIEPYDPEIQLNLSEVLILTNRQDQAIQLLEETVNHHPDHIRTSYRLGQIYTRSDDPSIRTKGEKLLIKVVSYLPANITSRLELVDLLLRNDKPDTAAGYLEELKKQVPEFPPEANEYYETSLRYMFENDAQKALPPFNIFRNILKPTPLWIPCCRQLRMGHQDTLLLVFSVPNTFWKRFRNTLLRSWSLIL